MKYVTVKAYSEKCGLPVRTVRRFCQEGKLPAMRIGRAFYIDDQAADAALEEETRISTARQSAVPDVPEVRCGNRRHSSFDFLKELNRLKREAAT